MTSIDRHRGDRMKSRFSAIVVVAALALGLTAAPSAAFAAPAQCRTIPVDVDPVLKSDLARAAFGVDGSGVKVGVISNSYNVNPANSTAEQNVADGLLPGAGNPCGYTTDVHVVREMPPPTPEFPAVSDDEGRAMLQLVHGVAPGAELYFASAGIELEDVEGAIDLLADQGVDIIVDDIISDGEPFYQESASSVRIAEKVAEGITYLSAAGNNTAVALQHLPGQEKTPIGAWETTAYRPAPCDPTVAVPAIPAGFTGYDCLDFDPGEGVATVSNINTYPAALRTEEGQTSVTLPVSMQWGEPYGSSRARFDMVVTTNEPEPYLVSPVAEHYPLGIGDVPFDLTGHLDPTDAVADEVNMQISIVRFTNDQPETQITPPIGYVFFPDGAQWAVSADWWKSQGPDTVGRSIVGHNGAPAAISVAATGAFDDDRIEYYSSLGPVTYYFTPETVDGSASPLPEPAVHHKPTILSVDGARQNVLTGPETAPGVFLFDGTSAATPTAGAVVALALQLNPQLTPAEVQALLVQTATPLASPYPTISAESSVGAGLIDAQALLNQIDADMQVPDPDSPTPRPVLAATGGSDAASALPLSVALLLLGGVLVAARRLRARSSAQR
jgi:hypothetical protein